MVLYRYLLDRQVRFTRLKCGFGPGPEGNCGLAESPHGASGDNSSSDRLHCYRNIKRLAGTDKRE